MTLLRILGLVLAASFAPAAGAQTAERGRGAAAGDACETAVAQAVREARGRAAREVRFVGSPRALAAAPPESIGVKGEGRYAGASGASVPFTYTCAYSPSSGATDGVMFSDKPAPAAPSTVDLSRLSPEACETATAAVLKERYPRIDRIRFGSDTRRLSPAGTDRTLLDGRGAAAHAPGMNAVAFGYRCEYDNRSGKVLQVRVDE